MCNLRPLPLIAFASLALSPAAGAVSLNVGPFDTVTLGPGIYRYDNVIIQGGILEFTGNATFDRRWRCQVEQRMDRL